MWDSHIHNAGKRKKQELERDSLDVRSAGPINELSVDVQAEGDLNLALEDRGVEVVLESLGHRGCGLW